MSAPLEINILVRITRISESVRDRHVSLASELLAIALSFGLFPRGGRALCTVDLGGVVKSLSKFEP